MFHTSCPTRTIFMYRPIPFGFHGYREACGLSCEIRMVLIWVPYICNSFCNTTVFTCGTRLFVLFPLSVKRRLRDENLHVFEGVEEVRRFRRRCHLGTIAPVCTTIYFAIGGRSSAVTVVQFVCFIPRSLDIDTSLLIENCFHCRFPLLFAFVRQPCVPQTANILRKIKTTLQLRKNKARRKGSQSNTTAASVATATAELGRAAAGTVAASVTISASGQQPPHCLNTAERRFASGVQSRAYQQNGAAIMETNLNRVLNQSGRHQLKGQLCKYTNVVKGWQYRWFTVDSQAGTLSYYLCDSTSSSAEDAAPSAGVLASAPRGQVSLAGAVVCPSDEDSRTFSIGCATGETLKLRAVDVRARQEWVDGLRAIVESHTKAMDISNSLPLPARELLAASDAMVSARQSLYLTEQSNVSLARAIESIEGTVFSPTDPDLLLLKAISTASTQCLHQCLSILQRHEDVKNTNPDSTGVY